MHWPSGADRDVHAPAPKHIAACKAALSLSWLLRRAVRVLTLYSQGTACVTVGFA
jgi:hypothetical protein